MLVAKTEEGYLYIESRGESRDTRISCFIQLSHQCTIHIKRWCDYVWSGHNHALKHPLQEQIVDAVALLPPQGPGFWLHQKAVRTLKPLQGKYDWAGIHPLLRQLIKIRLGQIWHRVRIVRLDYQGAIKFQYAYTTTFWTPLEVGTNLIIPSLVFIISIHPIYSLGIDRR